MWRSVIVIDMRSLVVCAMVHDASSYFTSGMHINYVLHVLVCVCMQVNPSLVNKMEARGLRFVGRDVEGDRMEIFELDGIV